VSMGDGCSATICDTSETALTAPPSSRPRSYDAIMKNLRADSSLLLHVLLAAVVLLAANALAQTDNPHASKELPRSIASARCQYAPNEAACVQVNESAQDRRGPIDDSKVAQLPRRGPGPGFGPRGPMGRSAYPGMWGQSEPSGRHVLIGAAIGALVGVALGAKGNAGARGTFGLSALCAGIGAGMGASVPSFPSRNPYFRRWPDDDDENASRRDSAKPGRTPGPPRQTASVDVAPSSPQPNTEDAAAPKTAAQP